MKNDDGTGGHIKTFFDKAYETFLNITNDESKVLIKDYTIDNRHIKLKFANSALMPIVTPALEHIHVENCSQPDINICLWDSQSTSSAMPPPPWSRRDYGERGEIKGYNDKRFTTAYHLGTHILSVFDKEKKTALYWMNDARTIPSYEASAPLKSILHWALKTYNKQMVHAAAIGRHDRGVIVVGKGGAGKSTIGLSSLISSLYYAGDDYILLGDNGDPVVFSLYNSAKVEWDHLKKFPHLVDKVNKPGGHDHEKAIIFVNDHYPEKIIRKMKIMAVLVPRITGERATGITAVQSSESIKAVVPSTVFQLAGADSGTFKFVSSIMKKLPCYSVEVGTEIEEISAVLTRFIDSLQG